ncbi:MAG: hypothetical protein Q8P05_03925 [Candidatus Diapherotrites archaeon]|nr:hypothetical protein [Candidatus Diapherotrites archaeon]
MTTKMVEGRILDKHFEEQINSNLDDARKQINANVHGAHTYVKKKQSMVEHAVSERPFEFVIGAFLGGLLIGALISKKG